MVSSLALLQRVHVGTHHQPRYGASLGQWDGQLPSPSSPGEGVAGRVPGRRATARLAAAEAAAAGGAPKMDTLPGRQPIRSGHTLTLLVPGIILQLYR